MSSATKESQGLPRAFILLGLAIGVLFDVVSVVLIAVAIGVYMSGGPSPSLNPTVISMLIAGVAATVGFSILLARRTGARQPT